MSRLIDADALIKDIYAQSDDGWFVVTAQDLEELINGQPTIEAVQERKGRWNRISPAKIYECSVCGRQVMTDDIDVYAFCHGCGAKMEGAEE